MAIDQISESVQRQERPVLSLNDFKSLSIKDHEEFDSLRRDKDFDKSLLLKSPSINNNFVISKLTHNLRSSTVSPVLWPPLKSAKYCKKQRLRSIKARGITPSKMLMHESSINHQRVTSVLNELSSENGCSLINSVSTFNPNAQSCLPFWSQKSCQEFWDEYLECDENFSDLLVLDSNVPPAREFSRMNFNSSQETEDYDNAHVCYTKITKSIRKLLRRTFTAAPTFAELENFVVELSKSSNSDKELFLSSFSGGQILNFSNIGATIKLDTPFHRVWLHAICQYHGLISQSKTVNDVRLVYINFRSGKHNHHHHNHNHNNYNHNHNHFQNQQLSTPKTSLYNYLQNL